jgi:hypothetical protein
MEGQMASARPHQSTRWSRGGARSPWAASFIPTRDGWCRIGAGVGSRQRSGRDGARAAHGGTALRSWCEAGAMTVPGDGRGAGLTHRAPVRCVHSPACFSGRTGFSPGVSTPGAIGASKRARRGAADLPPQTPTPVPSTPSPRLALQSCSTNQRPAGTLRQDAGDASMGRRDSQSAARRFRTRKDDATCR